jgi:hypothetical protein
MAPEYERGLSVPELFTDIRSCLDKACAIAESPKDPATLAYAMSLIDYACQELREAKAKIRSLKTAMNRECERQIRKRGPSVDMAEVFDICNERLARTPPRLSPDGDLF